MTKPRAIIYDIDGTISDPSHRLHLLPNHRAFLDACYEDPLHDPIREMTHITEKAGYTNILCSGRSKSVYDLTVKYMAEHDVRYNILYMRNEGDDRKDSVVKKEFLNDILKTYDVVLVVDDRQSVVDMWRAEGLTCLQCRPWNEGRLPPVKTYGLLTLLVGPTGCGKSTWVRSEEAKENFGIAESHIISTDQIRIDMMGTQMDMSRNREVFQVMRDLVEIRIQAGLPAVVDATNIRNADRKDLVKLTTEESPVRYIVLNRSLEEKYKTGGWRNELTRVDKETQEVKPYDLIAYQDNTFQQNLKAILAGDDFPNVLVYDLRVHR